MLYLLEHEFNWQIQAWAILMRLLQIKIFEVLLLCQSLQGKKKICSNFPQSILTFCKWYNNSFIQIDANLKSP